MRRAGWALTPKLRLFYYFTNRFQLCAQQLHDAAARLPRIF
jgi:hypothetical protein